MITRQSVLHADIGAVRALSDHWRRLADAIDENVEDFLRQTRDLPHHWASGPGSEAAAAKRAELPGRVGNAYSSCRSISSALNVHADEMEYLREQAWQLIDEAERVGLEVDRERGWLTVTHDLSITGDAYAGALDALVEQAEEQDQRLARVLGHLTVAANEIPAVVPPYPADVVVGLAGLDPDLQDYYWRELHPLHQERAIAEQPDVIAASPGIPARERRRAERVLRQRQRAELLAGRAHLEARLDGASNRALTQTEAALSRTSR